MDFSDENRREKGELLVKVANCCFLKACCCYCWCYCFIVMSRMVLLFLLLLLLLLPFLLFLWWWWWCCCCICCWLLLLVVVVVIVVAAFVVVVVGCCCRSRCCSCSKEIHRLFLSCKYRFYFVGNISLWFQLLEQQGNIQSRRRPDGIR